MFGRSTPKAFKPYTLGASKPRRRMPAWLLWLASGIVLGASGLTYVQQELMAPRLSPAESAELTRQASELAAALAHTQAQFEQASLELSDVRSRNEDLSVRLGQAQGALKPLEQDVQLLQEVLPADPRGGDLQIRAGRFYNRGEGLSYHLVLTREEQAPFAGAVQFAVQGQFPSGRSGTVTLEPLPIKLDGYQNLHGSLELPDDMQARQITTRILDEAGRTQAMRVINTRN